MDLDAFVFGLVTGALAGFLFGTFFWRSPPEDAEDEEAGDA